MIAEALNNLRAAIPQGVALVAVSKFHPAERLREAYDAGQRIFAESRPQELAAKVPQLPADIEWHFIGHLQTNKLKLVLPYVSLVQSVDSFHLLEAINNWGAQNGKVINVLLELHLGAEETKQGFTEEEIMSLIGKEEDCASENCCRPRHMSGRGPLAAGNGGKLAFTQALMAMGGTRTEGPRFSEAQSSFLPNVNIIGIMGMATNTDDMDVVERDFEKIESLFRRRQAVNPAIRELSIGMSADWQIAVKHSATMVRIGTDIFGPREM